MSDREHLHSLTEAVESFFAGTDHDTLTRLRTAAARARVALDHCEPDAAIACRVGYAAGAASQHTS